MNVNTAQKYSYQLLGRVAHLLQDMSVPAHVHNDIHPCDIGDPDSFEQYMGGSPLDILNCNYQPEDFPAKNYNGGVIFNGITIGLVNLVNMNDYDAIRFLFYTQNQLSDYFKSNDVLGDNLLPNGTNSYLENAYAFLGEPTNAEPVDFVNLSVINEISRGAMIADLVAIVGSTDIVLGEVDR